MAQLVTNPALYEATADVSRAFGTITDTLRDFDNALTDYERCANGEDSPQAARARTDLARELLRFEETNGPKEQLMRLLERARKTIGKKALEDAARPITFVDR